MAKEKKFITCDGNTAAAHVSYMFYRGSCHLPYHSVFSNGGACR
jgi:pyruvate-ferredoxin/flavodoxin oxidoreductase